MGAVTAREVLALLERRAAQLVAGASGLRRPVTWVVAMRPRPPAFEALEGGELALLSLSALRTLHAQDDSLSLARLIQDLAARNVAMIAVAGLRATEEAPPQVALPAPARAATPEEAELAASLGIPLVALPLGTALAEVEREVLAAVRRANAESDALDDTSRSTYDALLRASLRGEDDHALGGRLAELLGVAVALESAEGVEWCALPERFSISHEALLGLLARPSARALLRASENADTVEARPLGRDLTRLPVRLDVAPETSSGATERDQAPLPEQPFPGQVSGDPGARTYLSLIVPATAAQRAARLSATLAMVGPLFALALARRRDLAGVERRLGVEALDALLGGTYGDAAQMASRAAQLGHDLSQPHVALVVELDAGHVAQRPAVAALQNEAPSAWVRARPGELAALLPQPDAAVGSMTGLAERLSRAVGVHRWSAGLGRAVTGPGEVRRSYAEARDAARLGRMVLGPGHIARPADLGVYRLLLQLRGTDELDEFVRATLGPLVADARSGEALLETLDVFFACNGNLSEAARRLSLHRNSLIYRLNRARELLGHDLEDPELRLALQVALKARRVQEL